MTVTSNESLKYASSSSYSSSLRRAASRPPSQPPTTARIAWITIHRSAAPHEKSPPDHHEDGQQDAGDQAGERTVGLIGAGCNPAAHEAAQQDEQRGQELERHTLNGGNHHLLRRRPTHLEAQHDAITDLQDDVAHQCDEKADDHADDDPAPLQG